MTLMGMFKEPNTSSISFLYGVKPSKSSLEQSSTLSAPFFSAKMASSKVSTHASLIISRKVIAEKII